MVATDDDKLAFEFLRAYFQANYDVTVASGNAVLMSVKVGCHGNRCHDVIVGGVMLLLPDVEGSWGWKAKDQEPYDRAYHKNNLHKINPEALRRLKRFVQKTLMYTYIKLLL